MNPLLRRMLTSRLIRYPIYLFLLLFLFLCLVGIFLPEDYYWEDPLETDHHLYAGTNPYRDLPEDQLTVVKEILFTAETLRDVFLPTSLPDEDDYGFLSKLVRTLETREDISWTTLRETGVDSTLGHIANRRVFADEPYELTDRFRRLSEHWSRLALEEGKPERWEVEHDVTFLPPVLKVKGLEHQGGVNGGVEEEEEEGVLGALLTGEQREKMEERWAEWKKNRDRSVSYLKSHPPRPLAWFPVPKSQAGKIAAWTELVDDGAVEAGKSVDEERVVASQKWKPWYVGWEMEDVPMEWRAPGEEDMTPEEFDRWMAKFNRQREWGDERKRKQEEIQEKLKAGRDMVWEVKDEL
ncbi:hypothetical protein DL546_009358 [Coniochaeta pulveracea]|uniref:Uncharacterized protein n=1 Tax=Coniochaeta pulveracea TaxID=177199 RepID=A0A420YJ65_9PEZI|nr:hypothetical protein DL546_009358 [Coniochaeta pulveracea]